VFALRSDRLIYGLDLIATPILSFVQKTTALMVVKEQNHVLIYRDWMLTLCNKAILLLPEANVSPATL
jgi:hypothetical protein